MRWNRLEAVRPQLLQQSQQGAAGGALQFPGVEGSVMIGIGGAEALRDDGEVFVFCQGAVMIGIGRRKLFEIGRAHV